MREAVETLRSTEPLRAPRAAAVAGILFSVLLIASMLMLRLSVPADPLDRGEWLASKSGRVALAMNLVPFSGVAFLWFIGVLRDRLGAREDRLFASVFLGSGLLYLGMLFVAAAALHGVVGLYAADPAGFPGSPSFAFARVLAFEIANVYALKMAAVFIVVTSTLAWRTRFLARWAAWLGYAVAAALLVNTTYVAWILLAFPGWVLLVSLYILWDNLRASGSAGPATDG